MVVWNNSDTTEPIFILRGFPGLEYVHSHLSIPFCLAYLLAFIGNVTILSVIWTEFSLHQPMYYFLSMLALTDLGMSLSTLPTMLAVLCLDVREIQASACYAQLVFIHTFTFLEASVLLALGERWVLSPNPTESLSAPSTCHQMLGQTHGVAQEILIAHV